MAENGPLPQGSTLANGKYIIEGTLGAGGFGITYRARDMLLTRTVAIKELYPDGSQRRDSNVTVPLTYTHGRWEKAVSDFLREARTIASLEYPSIVAVYDYFQENNTAYMVMRFVDGVDLVQQMVLRGGKLSEAEALQYITEVGEALEILHSRGVLHRDIKPSNILVNRQGHAVLVDFGAAREFTVDGANTHTVMASYGFAPPEQFHAKAPRGPYTDIYSLAATCYYLLTGTLPTSDAEEGQEIRPQLRAALEHAMAYDPQQRPQNVATFIAELQGRIQPPPPESFAHSSDGGAIGNEAGGSAAQVSSPAGRISSEPTRTGPDAELRVPLSGGGGATPSQPISTPMPPGVAQTNVLSPELEQQIASSTYGQQLTAQGFGGSQYGPPPGDIPPDAKASGGGRGAPWLLIGGGLIALAALAVVLIIVLNGNNKGNNGGSNSTTPGVAVVTSPTAQSFLTPTLESIAPPSEVATSEVATGPVSTEETNVTPTQEVIITPTVASNATLTPTPLSGLPTDLANIYLYGVSMDSADDGWAVGTVMTGGDKAFTPGVLMHYQNQKWERDHISTVIPGLNAVSMLSADDGWAVGGTYTPTDSGIILHYTGGKWQTIHDIDPGQLTTLNSLSMVSKDEGWAVGGGVIAHYKNGKWGLDDNPASGVGLLAVFMLNSNEGWAVGGSGTILHYQNGQWGLVDSGTGGTLYGIYMTSADDGWAVGQAEIKSGDTQVSGLILHYSGGRWQQVNVSPMDALRSVSMISPSEGWAAGNYGAGLWNYTNGGWEAVDNSLGLGAVQMLSATDGWAVGGNGQGPLILHFSGNGNWTPYDFSATTSAPTTPAPDAGSGTDVTPSPITSTSYLNSLFMVSSSDGWAVGGTPNRKGLILRYSNGQWKQDATPDVGLTALYMDAPDDGWAVGFGGTMLHYTGDGWTVSDAVTDKDLYAVDMIAKNEGWVVGLGGTILHYDGNAWTSVDSGTTTNLYGISVATADNSWIVGDSGLMLHYSNGQWTPGAKVTSHTLHGIQVAANDGWATGFNGTILHYDGSKWTVVNSGTNNILHSLSMYSADDGWAVGDQGTILHYYSNNWTKVPSPTNEYLRCVFAAASDDVWAVGDRGDILHYQNSSWSLLPRQ